MEAGGQHLCVPPLLWSRMPVSPREELFHMSGCCLALETRRAYVPWSHGIVAIRETEIARSPPPGQCTDGRWLICLSWRSFVQKGRLLVCHSLGACGGTLREHRLEDMIFMLFLATMNQYLPERSLYSHLEPR